MQHYQPPQPPVQQPPASGTVAPADTYNQPQPTAAPTASTSQQTAGPSTVTAGPSLSSSSAPLVAQGDWTKNLVHLAKTAELKKHALTLQLHTAHIMSAQTQLDGKNKAKQDVHEQKSKLEIERQRLLKALQDVNADRDKAEMMVSSIEKECAELRAKIQLISDGEYAAAKHQVDSLRAELGMPPLPSLQQTMAEKSATYLNDRRINGPVEMTTGHFVAGTKRPTVEEPIQDVNSPNKRPRGRPKGSKNKSKGSSTEGA
ncbi:hypothetical protein SCHPADRAFT_836893 [Schizopora paradoxa]|uniref:Uncharacterized protein n=1 Tax=Schizopora paradoxa TaxID=27342 RepID=A0A0H2R699_9AGAM|nr:hypothetical protein SCHPADRAFT_836893 [Schizopora paradoxa]